MGISELVARFKGLVKRPPLDYDEGRYFLATVTPDDKAQRVYTYNASQAELLARATGYVHICAALNAKYCAGVPIRLYSRKGKGRKVKGLELEWLRRGVRGKAASYADNAKDVVEITQHEVLALLSNPNFSDTGIEFRTLTHYFGEVGGNAYWQHDASEGSPPRNLLNLFPQWTMPTIDDTGIVAYRYGRNFANREEIDAANVIQFRHLPSPQNPWMGVGCLNGSTVEADIYASAIVYEQSFWNNSARPDFALKLPAGSTEEERKQAYAMLERRNQGARKGGKPIVTTGDDMLVTPLQWSPREMEYGDGIDRMRRAILNAFGVPVTMLEMSDSALGGGGTMFEGRTQYLSQTIGPRMSAFCERLTENLLPTFNLEPGEYWFAPDNPDTEDQGKIEESSRADAEAAIRTINEARALRGLDPLPDGNELRYKGTLLADVGRVAEADPLTGKPKPKADPEKKNIDGATVSGKTLYTRQMVVCGHGSLDCTCHKDAPTEPEPSIYDPAFFLESDLRRIMERFYAAIDPTDYDKKEEAKKLRDELIIILLLLFQRGYESGTRRLRDAGVDAPIPGWQDGSPIATAFSDRYVPHLARTVTNTVAEVITAAKLEYEAGGGDPSGLAAALKEKVNELGKYGPERVAETETVGAFNTGTLAAWKESGVVKYVRWRTAEDEMVCPFCRELDGVAVPMDGGVWFEEGEKVSVTNERGTVQTMVFDYGAIFKPPLHPNCRCFLDYVLGEL